ncbi:putative rhomboid protease [Gregarina niphandrodes]|uniref:Rhomboid-like protease n=1 Tax=Gregarina niphandrodes TaxID=110365 RepID=A0A023BBG2_GRENI|nr:putative rhomboid protease [Gregarina niphandrodes]EZG79709.1 putative rhomboid protease [Gregarina niphandrodes]|eukprot:XP_011134391.1 putative rhomboid protease [Gregarina niphandrodes]
MVQVHTLRDLESGNAGNPSAAPFPSLTAAGRGQRPRCIELLFPGFKPKTFIFIISMVQIAIYVLCTVQYYGGMDWLPFGISSKGSSYGPAIVSGQVWRLITPIFLHAGFVHILFNMFFQMRMGFPLEEEYGTRIFAGMYLLCGLAGNLFSVALAPCKYAVGASTAGFGLIGIQMAQIALHWHLLQRKEEVTFNILFFFMMALMMSIGPDSVVDWRGHAGGFITGFCLGLIMTTTNSRPDWYEPFTRPVSLAVIGSVVLGSVVAIFSIPLASRGCGI